LKEKDVYTIWTVYFDSQLSRKRGRKISLRESVKEPKIPELVEASKRLGLEITNIKNAKYPSCWWIKGTGYIQVRKNNIKKYELIKNLAKELRKLRGGK
jgi:signal recognition particle subunit SRP19